MDVYFWHNIPSHHSAPALRRLAEVWPGQVYWVCHQATLAERLRMGWKPPEVGNVNLVILNGDRAKVDEIVERSRQDIHIVAAFERKFDTLPYAMHKLQQRGCARLGIVCESGDPRGIRGRLRFLLHKVKAWKWRSHVKMVQTIGSLGVDYFTRAGFDPKVVIPYMYQVDETACEEGEASLDVSNLARVRLIYVGQLVPLKGVDLLLQALEEIRGHNWTLSVAGAGPEQERLKRLAARLGLDEKVQWHGSVPASHVHGLLQQHDVCVCPSRYDGWCMVVSEALYAGIGVITTEAAGARDVVWSSGAGRVVRSESVLALRRALEEVLARPACVREWKQRARRYRPCLSGQAVGDYLFRVLEHVFLKKGPRPSEPWLPGAASCQED